ncbi:glycosyltransferase [Acinetobacter brisouii]|uniref:glycosyltransferase n=1 Tax=Acinetobacter brisouii TaxID=396323 RepID=UPI00124DD52C|nr:glycosyltransferase [Acinetobacter brisouii]
MLKVRVEGPYYGTYSLSAVNANLAIALAKHDFVEVSISATSAENWRRDAVAEKDLQKLGVIYKDMRDQNYKPDVVIRNSWPITHDYLAKDALKIRWFAWEETVVPIEIIKGFNESYDVVAAKSKFVQDALVNSGLTTISTVVPDACVLPVKYVDPLDNNYVNFLHVSSCFPRKAPDVLIKAYLKSFTAKDKVILTIKTFDNPHNEIRKLIEEFREETNSDAKINLIVQDLPDHDLVNLFNTCHYLVFPSRGEGYGLPVAEAHAVGRPTIIPKSSSLAELFIDNIDYAIEFTPAFADTHVSSAGSLWFEPDIDSLVTCFKQAYDDYFSGVYKKKIRMLKDRENTSTWDIAAEKLFNCIDNFKKFKPKKFPEKLCIISSFSQVCGLATYLECLLAHFPKNFKKPQDITILAPIIDGKEEGSIEDVYVDGIGKIKIIRVWHYWGDVFTPIKKYINNYLPDAVIIQHHTGFFSPNQLNLILDHLNKLEIKNITTLHSYFPEDIPDGQGDYIKLVKAQENKSSKILVHSLREYIKNFSATNFDLFPHGYASSNEYAELRPNGEDSNSNSYVVSSFGFLRRHKGVRELLEAWPFVLKREPNAKLILLCSEFPSDDSKLEVKECKDMIESLELGGSVYLDTSFHDLDVIEAILGYSDVVVFPYLKINEGASGAVRAAITAHSAIICSDNELFDEFGDAILKSDISPKVFADNIVSVIHDREKREMLRYEAKKLEKSLSWDNVALRYWSFFLEKKI